MIVSIPFWGLGDQLMSVATQPVFKGPGGGRQHFVILGAFVLGGLTASVTFWSLKHIEHDVAPGTGRTPELHGPPLVSRHHDEGLSEHHRPRPWLPTRTFECPRCGSEVPTNDNSLPILLLGFLGQGAFGLRFFVQWIASERAKASVIPEVFWWLSIGGGVLLLMYGWALLAWPIIVGQGLNCAIYGRNLALLKRRAGAVETKGDR